MEADTSHLSTIVDNMVQTRTALHVTIVGPPMDDSDQSVRASNCRLLRDTAEQTAGVCMPLDIMNTLFATEQVKAVKQVTKFRGALMLSQDLVVPVWAYGRTALSKTPSLKRVSMEADVASSRAVKAETCYYAQNDPHTEVPPEERVRGHRYGRQLVPMSDDQEKLTKLTKPKALCVLGFVNRSAVGRHLFLDTVDVIVHEPGNSHAAQVLSALARAMERKGVVAIASFVKRANASVHLGALFTHIKRKEGKHVEGLLWARLPYAEDFRHLELGCFSKVGVSSAQQDMAQEFVRSMSLMQADVNISFRTQEIFNPAIHHFNTCVQKLASSKTEDVDTIPLLKESIHVMLHPPTKLEPDNVPALQSMQQLFPTVVVTAKEKESKRKNWQSQSIADDALAKRAKLLQDSNGQMLSSSELTIDVNAVMLNILLSSTVDVARLWLGLACRFCSGAARR